MNADAGYWHQCTAAADGTEPALGTEIETDVLILGAGYTGLSTALHCRELGLEACVLEASTPGFGASGRNAGQWLPGWVGLSPSQVEARHGQAAGARLNAFNVEAVKLVPALVHKHQIDAALRPTGVLQVAGNEKALQRLRMLAEEWRQYDTTVSVLDRGGLTDHLRTDRYRGGILFHDAGCLNPLAFVRGLASAARRIGARIYCHSAALDLQPAGSEWQALTRTGKVRARRVVIATDAFEQPALWPRLHESFYRLAIPMLCSPVLPGGGRDFLPRGTPFAELRPGGLLFGGMLEPSGRWIASTAPHFWSTSRDKLGAWALNRFRRVFPQVAPFQWETLWWGNLGISRDTLPCIWALANGVHAVNGYSGGGIALATALGRAMARMLSSGDVRELPMTPRPLASVPLRRLVPALLRGVAMPLAKTLDAIRD